MDQGRIDKIVSETFREELPGVLLFLVIVAAALTALIAALTLFSERQIYCAAGILIAFIAAAWWVFRDPALFDDADRNSRNAR